MWSWRARLRGVASTLWKAPGSGIWAIRGKRSWPGPTGKLRREWKIGGSTTLRDGEHATIFAIGNLVKAALDAHDILAEEGIGLRVVDMYSIRPIDRQAILDAAASHGLVFTAEEHNVTGGFGAAVAEVLAEAGTGARLVKIGMPDAYSILGPPTHLYRHYGLDGDGVAATVRKALA